MSAERITDSNVSKGPHDLSTLATSARIPRAPKVVNLTTSARKCLSPELRQPIIPSGLTDLLASHEKAKKLRDELLAINHKASPEDALAWDVKHAELNAAREAFTDAASVFVVVNGSDLLRLASTALRLNVVEGEG